MLSNFCQRGIVFLLLSTACWAHGQTPGLSDSLQRAMDPLPDTVKFRTYLDLAWDTYPVSSGVALEYAEKAVFYARSIDSLRLSQALCMRAVVEDISGSPELALKDYLHAMAIQERFGRKKDLGVTYSNIGALYYTRDQYEKALHYFDLALKQENAVGDLAGAAGSYINQGVIYKNLGKPALAIRKYIRALQIEQALGIDDELSTIFHNLGALYLQQGQLDSAYLLTHRSIGYARKTNDPLSLILSYRNLVDYFLERHDHYDSAIYYGHKSHELARKTGNPEEASLSLEYLAKAEEQGGRLPEALQHYHEFLQLRDSLYNADVQEKMVALEMKYENKKKAAEIYRLQAENKLKALALAKSNTEKWFLIMGVIMAMITIGLLTYLFVLKQKKNSELAAGSEALKKALAEKEILLKEIHHRVKNNLQIVSSLLALQSGHIRDPETLKAFREGRNRVKSMALLHQSLYQGEHITGVKVKEYLTSLVEKLLISYGYDENNITLTMEIDNLELDIETALPIGLIVNELVSNALKYAFPGGTGMLSVELTELTGAGTLTLRVADNGVGLVETGEKEGSFGLSLVRSLAKKLQADLTVEGREGTSAKLVIKHWKCRGRAVDAAASTHLSQVPERAMPHEREAGVIKTA